MIDKKHIDKLLFWLKEVGDGEFNVQKTCREMGLHKTDMTKTVLHLRPLSLHQCLLIEIASKGVIKAETLCNERAQATLHLCLSVAEQRRSADESV